MSRASYQTLRRLAWGITKFRRHFLIVHFAQDALCHHYSIFPVTSPPWKSSAASNCPLPPLPGGFLCEYGHSNRLDAVDSDCPLPRPLPCLPPALAPLTISHKSPKGVYAGHLPALSQSPDCPGIHPDLSSPVCFTFHFT